MFKVTNTSKETQQFWADDDQGVRGLYRLEPGQSVTANIDPNQPRFGKGGAYEVAKTRSGPAPSEDTAAKPKA